MENKANLSTWMLAAGQGASIEAGMLKTRELSVALDDRSPPKRLRDMIHTFVKRVDLASDRIWIAIDKSTIVNATVGAAITTAAEGSADDKHIIDLPLSIKKRGVERRLVIEGQGWSRDLDRSLIDAIARAHLYRDALAKGQGRKDVARRYGVHPEDVSGVLPLAFLSPQITQTILTGRRPADLTARDLKRGINLPIDWAGQNELFKN